MKSVIISGFSGGMGLETAKKFASNGFFVFGLDINEPKEIVPNSLFIKSDLTKKEDIARAYEAISSKTSEIEAIISMAGIYELGSLVEMSEEAFIRAYDINLFSIYRLNKAFLPLLEKNGKCIIVSSELAPLDPLPFTGIYALTKSAVEKYAYSLRMELQLLGKKVVVIRSGAVSTGLLDVSMAKIDGFEKETKLYKYNANRFKKIASSVESKNASPKKIAELAYKIEKKKNPRYVYKINRNPLLLLLNALPDRLQNFIIKKILTSK